MSDDEIVLNPDEISKSRWERLVAADILPSLFQLTVLILAGFGIGTLLALGGADMIPPALMVVGVIFLVGTAIGAFLADELRNR